MIVIYENQEWEVIGQNYYDYMIVRFDMNEDDYFMRVVSKKEVQIKE